MSKFMAVREPVNVMSAYGVITERIYFTEAELERNPDAEIIGMWGKNEVHFKLKDIISINIEVIAGTQRRKIWINGNRRDYRAVMSNGDFADLIEITNSNVVSIATAASAPAPSASVPLVRGKDYEAMAAQFEAEGDDLLNAAVRPEDIIERDASDFFDTTEMFDDTVGGDQLTPVSIEAYVSGELARLGLEKSKLNSNSGVMQLLRAGVRFSR